MNAKKTLKANARPFSFFFLRLGACVGFTTLPIIYLTGRLIAALHADSVLSVGAYRIFLVALVAPLFTLAWLWVRVPAHTHRLTGFYSNAAEWGYRPVLSALLALSGLVFLALVIFLHR